MNITKSIVHLFPNAVPMTDFVVQDDSNGNGPYIKKWNLTAPQPTQTELDTAWNQVKNNTDSPSTESRLSSAEAAILSLMGL